ncbi:MAG: L,D-transpeptidase family protein, partial [Candidatus Paceibacterota bacterium]
MHVTRKHHRRVTLSLAGALLLLAIIILLGLWMFFTGTIEYNKQTTDSNQSKAEDYYTAPPSPFLQDEEVVIISSATSSEAEEVLPVEKVLFEYVEVTDGCGPHFEGECLNVRSGPGTDYPVVSQLRNEIVLKVGGKVTRDGETWFKIVFDEWLRYPERVTSDWYVSADYVEVLLDEGVKTLEDNGRISNTKKEITVNRGEQKLYAYEDGELFMETDISTGLALTPTPRGTFTIFRKTPSRYMQGPLPGLPSDQYYDLPGVPWNLYFTSGGAVIHGAYWHTSFGSRYSHGCVNLPSDMARKLYEWAEIGTKVIVKD